MAEPMDDVIIRCGNDLFSANCSKLSSASPYFRSMFASKWVETKTGVISLPTIRGEVMKVLLEFVYNDEEALEDEEPSEDFLIELVVASHLLQINSAYEFCLNKLEERVNLDNFWNLYGLSELYNSCHLALCIETFLAKSIQDAVKCCDFLHLTKDQLRAIYCNPAFNKSATDHFVRGLLYWAMFFDEDLKSKVHEADVLNLLTLNVDLEHLSTDYLTALLKDKRFVTRNQQITTLLMTEAVTRTITVPQRSHEYSNTTKLYCFGKNNERQVVRIYDIDSNMWSPGVDLPFDLEYGMAVIGHGSYIYFFGRGEVDRVIPSKTVLKYCPETNTAMSAGSLNCPVFMAQAGMVYEAIYLIGGMNKDKRVVKTVQRYSPLTGFCQEVASTNKRHSWPYIFAFRRHLYIASCKNNSTKNMERYDVLTDQWTMMTNIPGSFRAAFSGTKLFSVQKILDTSFQVYDVSTEDQKVIKFTDGPYEIFELWAARKRGKHVLLARDRENVLHWYDIESGRWDTTMIPNHMPWHGWQTCTL